MSGASVTTEVAYNEAILKVPGTPLIRLRFVTVSSVEESAGDTSCGGLFHGPNISNLGDGELETEAFTSRYIVHVPFPRKVNSSIRVYMSTITLCSLVTLGLFTQYVSLSDIFTPYSETMWRHYLSKKLISERLFGA